METKKVLSQVSKTITMPKNISIGDPLYFEEQDEATLKSLTYSKDFSKFSNWVSSLSVIKYQDSFEFEGEDITYEQVEFFIYLAPNEQLLKIYKEGDVLRSQRQENIDIGVDTARYIVKVDDREVEIRTMSDGFFGYTLELYKGSNLEGVLINLDTGEYSDFDRVKSDLEYLFNVKF